MDTYRSQRAISPLRDTLSYLPLEGKLDLERCLEKLRSRRHANASLFYVTCSSTLANSKQFRILSRAISEILSGLIFCRLGGEFRRLRTLETQKSTQDPEIPEERTPRLRELFQQVRANFCLLALWNETGTRQKLSRETCSDELFLFWVDVFQMDFLPLRLFRCPIQALSSWRQSLNPGSAHI